MPPKKTNVKKTSTKVDTNNNDNNDNGDNNDNNIITINETNQIEKLTLKKSSSKKTASKQS